MAIQKQYFLGIKGIEFVWHGDWADPEIIYKRHTFNCWDVQAGLELMYNDYVEQGYIRPVEGGWSDYYAKHPADVKALLDDYIWAAKESRKTVKKAPAKKTVRKTVKKAPAKKKTTKRRA